MKKIQLLFFLTIFLMLISVGCLGETTPSTSAPTVTTAPTTTTAPSTTTPAPTTTTAPTTTPAPTTTAPVVAEEIHEEEAPHEEGHGVPHEFEDMMNPVSATEASITKGHDLYALKCANCHGGEGRGDGHMAMMFDPKPSNLNDAHVQENTDGALFYIITEGGEDTDMPSFKTLSEEDRWNLVNYLRTFELEEHGHEEG